MSGVSLISVQLVIFFGVVNTSFQRLSVLTFLSIIVPASSNALSVQLSCIDASPNGDLWIGTRDSGLSKLNHKTNTFTHYQHDLNDPASEISKRVATYATQQIRADLGLNPGIRYRNL